MIHLPDESICLTDPLLQTGWDVYWLAPTRLHRFYGKNKASKLPYTPPQTQCIASLSTLGIGYGCAHV